MTEHFQSITDDIVTHPLFVQLRACPHHGGENSLYAHSVDTAKCAYRLAKRFRMREDRVRAVTRAALLHDFFGYDWQSERHRRYTGGQTACLAWTSASARQLPATCSPWPPGRKIPRPGC